MPEYAWICPNLHDGFYFTFPLWLHYITCGSLFEGPQETRGLSLKESEAVFSKWQNFILSIAALSIIHLFLILD